MRVVEISTSRLRIRTRPEVNRADWLVALAVVVGLAATYVFAHYGDVPIWWLLPVVVILVLPISIVRLLRRSLCP